MKAWAQFWPVVFVVILVVWVWHTIAVQFVHPLLAAWTG